MAAAMLSLRAFSLPHRGLVNPRNLSSRLRSLRIAHVRASSTAATAVETKPDPVKDARTIGGVQSLACPVCYYPLISKDDSSFSLESTSAATVACSTCKKTYLGNETYLDLTVSGGSEEYTESVTPVTGLFRSPVVSFLYERGWRQTFMWGGFPGPEKEFEMAKDYLKHTIGGTIIDASCGSGLFSRLFAKSGMYKLVVALDFSENMLQQCNDFVKQESISKENLILIRADISRLPFVSSSIDAVHAGAALHCWPSPSAAVADISRVLRPGGVFVATTFIFGGLSAAIPALRTARQFYTQITSQHFYASEGELEDLCRACGFVGFTSVRNGSFVMISASKPT